MTFFDPSPPVAHKCPLPAFPSQPGWRCLCGKAYVKETLGLRDLNPGDATWQWRRSPEHDED